MIDIKIPERKNYQVGVRIDASTYFWLKKLAVAKKVTVSEVLRAIVEMYFKKEND